VNFLFLYMEIYPIWQFLYKNAGKRRFFNSSEWSFMGIKVLYRGSEAEIIEKKSRFIATVRPVQSEEEAVAFIDEMKKRYWDARHNCSAFTIGDNNQLTRCSDDGEPSGTAGKPMLEVLLGREVHNVAVVVTRYFGGVLLGTGGLVRAYQAAVKAGLEASDIVEKEYGVRYKIVTDYNGIGKIQYILAKEEIFTINTEYTDAVTVEIILPCSKENHVLKEITEGTGGKAVFERGEESLFGILDGEIIE